MFQRSFTGVPVTARTHLFGRCLPPPLYTSSCPQLFWHGKELTDAGYGGKTLEQMNIHTGFGVSGYDLSEPPDYWPEVEETADGLRIKEAAPQAPPTRADMGYTDGLTMEEAIAKYREPGAVYWCVCIHSRGGGAATTCMHSLNVLARGRICAHASSIYHVFTMFTLYRYILRTLGSTPDGLI